MSKLNESPDIVTGSDGDFSYGGILYKSGVSGGTQQFNVESEGFFRDLGDM